MLLLTILQFFLLIFFLYVSQHCSVRHILVSILFADGEEILLVFDEFTLVFHKKMIFAGMFWLKIETWS